MPFDMVYRRIPQPGDQGYTAAVERMREEVAQLKRELAITRIPISQSANEMLQYTLGRQNEDPLTNDKMLAEKNPYEEKKSCVIL